MNIKSICLHPSAILSDKYRNFEYNEESLKEMMFMQNSLQEFIGKERGSDYPRDPSLTWMKRSDNVVYFQGCVVTEWFELNEQIQIFENTDYPDEISERNQKLEIDYEYIDMVHFIYNMFLYSEIFDIENFTLGKFYEMVDEEELNGAEYKIENRWYYYSEMSSHMGQFMNNLPYKHWKTYDSKYVPDENIKKLLKGLAVSIMLEFVRIGKCLNISKEHFYNLYKTKNQENFDRQTNIEKGYIKG
jgi:dimeric dUTPase (all-alpha-NTP-PPase superfamily)